MEWALQFFRQLMGKYPVYYDHLLYWSMVNLFFRYTGQNCSIYEIYPESETPNLTQIAHLDLDPSKSPGVCLLPGTVIWHDLYRDRIVFRVWDYRLNHSISFSVDVDVDNFDFDLKVYFNLLKHSNWPLTLFVGR